MEADEQEWTQDRSWRQARQAPPTPGSTNDGVTDTTDEGYAWCIGQNAEEDLDLKKRNQNDLREAWGGQEDNWLSE